MWVIKAGDAAPTLVDDSTLLYWRGLGYEEWEPGLAGQIADSSSAVGAALRAAFVSPTPQVVYLDPNGSDLFFGLLPSAPKKTLAAALAALPAAGGVVEVTPNSAFTMGAGDSFTLDAAKVGIHGENVTFTWTAAPTAGFAVKVISTASYTSRYDNWRRVLSGVVVRGNISAGAQLAAIGLQVGESGGGVEMSNFVMDNGGVEGFATCLAIRSNAWRTHWVDFHLRNGGTAAIDVPAGLTNYGECMTFTRCMIEGEVKIASGEHHFFGCSFDNAQITMSGDGKAYTIGCHYENPTPLAANKRFASLTGSACALHITACEILINGLVDTSPWTLCLFYVDSTVTSRGLVLSNVNIPQTNMYRPELGADGIRSLVAGTGRVVARGITMNDNSNAYPIAPSLNMLHNGDGEVGTTAGWAVTGSGGAGALTVDTTTKRTGTASLKIAPGAGLNTTLRQVAPCRPGDWVLVSGWLNCVRGATGTSANLKGTFLAADGTTTLGDFGFSSLAQNTSGWFLWPKGAVAPKAAAFVRIEIFVQSGDSSNLATVNIDDFLLTVV